MFMKLFAFAAIIQSPGPIKTNFLHDIPTTLFKYGFTYLPYQFFFLGKGLYPALDS